MAIRLRKKRRKGMDPRRVEAVMATLPREALLEIRNALPPKPKSEQGAQSHAALRASGSARGKSAHVRTGKAGSITCLLRKRSGRGQEQPHPRAVAAMPGLRQ